jgi:hypothetical protein
VLTDAGRRLMDEAMAAWEGARVRLAEALGEEASRAAGSVMSQLAVAAQDSSGPKRHANRIAVRDVRHLTIRGCASTSATHDHCAVLTQWSLGAYRRKIHHSLNPHTGLAGPSVGQKLLRGVRVLIPLQSRSETIE